MLTIIGKGVKNIVNIFIFLPYYFNIEQHLKHLFSPWKQIVAVRREKGFDFNKSMERLSWNFVSRGMGVLIRSSVIITYLLVLSAFTLVGAPFLLVLTLLLSPFQYVKKLIQTQSEAKKNKAEKFVQNHMLVSTNRERVEEWFESFYSALSLKKDIFNLVNLFAVAPIGRDWAYGYTPELDKYTTDLTSPLSYKNHLIGRSSEIKEIEQGLVKSYEANVILVGEEGVGKHTIIDGLAQNIYSGKTNSVLQNMRILELNMEKVLTEGKSLEEKAIVLENLFEEAACAKNIILVISDFHKYVSSQFLGDYTSIFEKYGKRPRIKLLAITTPFYYEQIIFHNDKLQHLFNKVQINEIQPLRALKILQEKALYFEGVYNLIIPFESLERIVQRSEFYITHIPFPEKAIVLLDETCIEAKERSIKILLPELVDKVLSKKTHVPVGELSADLKDRLLKLEEVLGGKIIGQDFAIKQIGLSIRRAFIEENKKKPRVSLLFLGPTGVGKTQTAKELARIFFGKVDKLIRFDMSFYQEQSSLKDLIGSFESKNAGLMANSIRENPYSVLLIDEIEKADKNILNIFLTLLDEGYLVDGFGEKVDCKNLIFIATSNAASVEIQNLIKSEITNETLENEVREMVISKAIFTPEFLNRFDKVLVFNPLSLEVAETIATLVVGKVVKEYEEQKKIVLNIDLSKVKQLVSQSFNTKNGAREIERVVREYISDKAAKEVLSTV